MEHAGKMHRAFAAAHDRQELIMRKLLIMTVIVSVMGAASGQVCNTASTLHPGKFSIGVAPVIYVDYHKDVGLFLNGGIGITRNMDLSVKLILNDYATYFGGDIEFVVLNGSPTISLAAGMHAYDKLGIDATFNLSFQIQRIASLYCGLDADVEFQDHGTAFPFWGFIGLQLMVRRHLGVFMEIDIGISNPAPSMLDLGLNVFF